MGNGIHQILRIKEEEAEGNEEGRQGGRVETVEAVAHCCPSTQLRLVSTFESPILAGCGPRELQSEF